MSPAWSVQTEEHVIGRLAVQPGGPAWRSGLQGAAPGWSLTGPT